MPRDLTADNVDDIIRDTLKTNFDELTRRIAALETLVREDLALDKTQSLDTKPSDSKLDHISSRIDGLKNDLYLLKTQVDQMRVEIANIIRILSEPKP